VRGGFSKREKLFANWIGGVGREGEQEDREEAFNGKRRTV